MAHQRSTDLTGIPSEFVHPNIKKSKEYILQYGKAIYSQKSQTTWDEQLERIIINRKYAEGLQSISKYKNLMGIEEGDTSYLNIDWSVIPISSKYVELRVGEMINDDSKVTCTTTDPQSHSEKDDIRNRYLANMMLKKYSDQIQEATGISLIPEGEYVPESEEALDIQLQLTLKQATEIGSEELINWELFDNEWKQIKKKIARDLVVIKKSGAKLYYDENNMIRVRWVDWANVIVPFSVRDDLKDIKYAAEILKLPVHQLRKMAKGALSENDLFEISRNQSNKHGNRVWKYGHSFHQYYEKYQRTEYDDFLIPVLDFNFVSINTNKYEKKANNYNGNYFQPKPYDYEPKDEKKKLIEKDIEFTYKGMWVIDTEHLINYGVQEDILRERKHRKLSPKAPLPWIFIAPDQYDMENKSLAEKMRPHDDAVQIVHKKMQVLIAKLKPPGTAVDVDALRGVILGKGGANPDGSWSPLQLQDLAEQTGYHYYAGADEEGRPMNRRPIESMPHAIGQALQELIAIYNFQIQQIQDITGLNQIRDASLPDKDAGLGVQRLQLQASRNATRGLDYSFDDIYEGIAKRIALMLMFNISKGRNKDVYENIIGKEMYKALENGKHHLEFDIKVEAGPTEQDKALLESNIQNSIAAKELRIEDAIMIRSIPNIKLANQYIILRRKQYQKELQEQSERQIQIQMQEATQAAQVKQQGEQQTIMAKAQAEVEVERVVKQLEDENAEKAHLRKMKEITLQLSLKGMQENQRQSVNQGV